MLFYFDCGQSWNFKKKKKIRLQDKGMSQQLEGSQCCSSIVCLTLCSRKTAQLEKTPETPDDDLMILRISTNPKTYRSGICKMYGIDKTQNTTYLDKKHFI